LKGKVEVFLELEEVAEIEKQAKEKDISRSAWIRDAVLEKLERKAVEYRNNKVKEGK
jgi:metal-responsive CopG/Arc/MetJ family transcriptional regulator